MAFEFDAERYKKASPHQRQWGQKLISELDLKGDERILDLGCGDGGITAQLAELVPEGWAIGIDASQQMIEHAQKEHKKDNIDFIVMDIDDIDFEDEFNVIFSNATLHWVKDHGRLLENVYKALKKGGVVRFQFAGDGNCSNLFRVVKEVMAEERYTRYFVDFDWPWYMPAIDEYKKLLEKSSFKEAKVWGENTDRFFADAETITGWIEQPSLVPFLKYVEGVDKQAFRDAVVGRMLEETIQKDGTYFETFRRINVFCT